MSERIDRRIPGSGLLLMAVIILAVFASAGLYFWSRMEASNPPQSAAPQNTVPPSPVLQPGEPLMVMLSYPSGGTLTGESVGVTRQFDAQSQAKEAASALFSHQRSGRAAVLKDVRLRAFYFDASGTAYVDLSPASEQKNVRGSAWDEFLALYAVVNTLTQNFEEIKQVRFLLDGREAQTLAGHIDLSVVFRPRPDLVKQ